MAINIYVCTRACVCKGTFWSIAQGFWTMTHWAQNNEFVRKWARYWIFDHNRLVSIRMNKTNSLKKKSTHRLDPRKICSYIFLLDLYKNSSSWLHSDFSYGFSLDPPIMEFFPFYIPFPSFILAFLVQIWLLISLILVLSVPSWNL